MSAFVPGDRGRRTCVDVTWRWHVRYGNRYPRPSRKGHHDFLFLAVQGAKVDQLIVEFARKGYEDLDVIQRFGWDRALGLGVADVKSEEVESSQLIAQRIRRALEVFPPEKLIIIRTVGCVTRPRRVARAELCATVEGAVAVRGTLLSPLAEDRVLLEDRPMTASEPTVEQGV